MASLSLKHIYKVYDGTTRAVSDFNMEIRDREFIIFVGPSGCGKSTTLRMIAGLEDISAGELRIDNVVVNDMEPRDRNIAMVFQNYALYPHMTVYENMAFSLKTAHEPKEVIHRKVTEAAEILGITEYLGRKPKALSGGQRQRVALGRAIVRSPKVFLFDEPLSNLDAKLRAAMRAEILRLYERLGTTFIYVTHDQVEAMTMGSRIVVMRGGYVQQIDTPKNLYNHPANLFVAGFIGTPRMNFWAGTLQRSGNQVEVALACGSRFTVPYEHFYHVQTRYMDGHYPIVIGVRPDDVRPWEAGLSPSEWIRLPARVDVVETPGGESLIYATLGEEDTVPLPEENGSECSSVVILKANADVTVVHGDTIEIAVNLHKLHIFDRAGGESLAPQIPRENVIPCSLQKDALSFAGQRFPLPPALCGKVPSQASKGQENPAYLLHLPTDALLLGTGSGRATVEAVTIMPLEGDTASCTLYRLLVGGEIFFARERSEEEQPRFAVGDVLPFDPDFSRIEIEGTSITPMPTSNRLEARFVKEKETDLRTDSPTRGKRIYRFFLDVADRLLETDDAFCQKLFSCKGTAIFRTPLALCFPPDATVVTRRAVGVEPKRDALPGRVTERWDYGRTVYARIAVGAAHIMAPYSGDIGDSVDVRPVLDRVQVIDRDADIIII